MTLLIVITCMTALLTFLSPLCNYVQDDVLKDRVCPDGTVNSYGLKLIQLCIESGLRILNGRHADNMANDFTYCGANGCSVIDYVLSTPDIFPYFHKFIVCSFNTYSDHAPLHIELKARMKVDIANEQSDSNDDDVKYVKYRWNSDLSKWEQGIFRTKHSLFAEMYWWKWYGDERRFRKTVSSPLWMNYLPWCHHIINRLWVKNALM